MLKKINIVLVILGLISTRVSATDENYRPAFHYTPKHNWMNDPNGLVFIDGQYHLFYQYNPYGITWGPMHWGHAISKDLRVWEELPIALFPDSLGTIFSGSAIYDKDNTSDLGSRENPPLVAVFTYNQQFFEYSGGASGQSQGLAYSLDKGLTWQKYAHNPILKNLNERDFRDPKIIWYAPQEKWVMSLAVNKKISFYSSKNLLQWQYESDFGEGVGAKGGIWECPDLIPLRIAGSGKKKYLLLVSLNPGAVNRGSGTQYFVGDFDGKAFTLDPKFKAQLQHNINRKESPAEWVDYGADNYAGVSWSNLPDQRTLSIGWLNNWDYGQMTPLQPWRGAMTLPRELSLIETKDRYVLKSTPARELQSLVKKTIKLDPLTVNGQYDVFAGQKADTFPQYVQLQLNSQAPGRIDIEIGAGKEKSRLTIDRNKMQILFDRDKSGLTNFSDKFVGVQRAPLRWQSDNIKLEFYVDKSSIEIFMNDGEVVFTNQIFPTETLNRLSIHTDKNVKLIGGSLSYF